MPATLTPELTQAFIQWGFPSFFMCLVVLVCRLIVRDHLATNRMMPRSCENTATAITAATAQLAALQEHLHEAARSSSEDHADIHEVSKATLENTYELLRRIPARVPQED